MLNVMLQQKMSWQIHEHFISRQSTHLEPKKRKLAFNVDNYDWWPYSTCHDEVLPMIQRAFHDPDAFIEKLFHDHSLPAVKDLCVCVRSASGFLRYLSAIVEDPFLIWAKCERNENASSLQDISAKKTCLRRFRLCQPYVITPGFFPCRHHAMSKTIRTVGS